MNSLALGVLGNLATEALKTMAPSPLRDVVAVLIWPLVILAVVVIAIAVIRAELPSKATATAPDPRSTQRDKRLDELEQEKAREQRRMLGSALKDMANKARGIRSDHEQPSDTFHGRQGSADAWARADAWDTKVRRILARDTKDEPTLLRDFAAAIEAIAQGDPDWRVNLARFLAIKAKRLDDIGDRLQMGG